MHRLKRPNDAELWFMEELKARIVAESGRAEDRFHFGKIILQSLKDAPDFVLQIDGVTGKSETSGSVLERSVKCANAFRKIGLKCGDVINLIAPNHLDLCIPYYAALYLGVAIAPTDISFRIRELQNLFTIDEPKIVFCQSNKAKDIRTALQNSKLEAKIVTFDKNPEEVEDAISFKEFIEDFGDGPTVTDFKATDFDLLETVALLISTSGTTGLPKQAAITHKNIAIGQSRPTYLIISPTLLTILLKPGDRDKCDFTCFQTILVGGSAIPDDLFGTMKSISPKTDVFNVYAMSETSTIVFVWNSHSPRTSGQPAPMFQHRLINVDTQEDIVEANTPGELWVKGPTIFKGYYKNTEATKATFAEDGWFKTGDLFYRDEHWNFYFVERIKLLLKYVSHQISPVEIENVIRQLAGVLDVAVTGIPDKECGELPVACVVTRPGHSLTAQQIKDLVTDNLAESKQLRGGVIFLDAIPVTATTKVDYRRLKEIAATTRRE